jgi:hypothetical protein
MGQGPLAMSGVAIIAENYGDPIWNPDRRMFAGETMALLGGGWSLHGFDAERELMDRCRVMAINSSIRLAPWADVLVFTDNNWYDDNRAAVEAFPGLVVTPSRHAKHKSPGKVNRISVINRPDFTFGSGTDMKFGRSSGHTGITVAIALGVTRILLLGYDMRIVDGRSHFHDEYGTQDHKLFSHDFLVHWKDWRKAAEAVGVDIINCTPGSALKEFREMSLEEALAL